MVGTDGAKKDISPHCHLQIHMKSIRKAGLLIHLELISLTYMAIKNQYHAECLGRLKNYCCNSQMLKCKVCGTYAVFKYTPERTKHKN